MKFCYSSVIASLVLVSAQNAGSGAGSVEPTGPLAGTDRLSQFGLMTIHSGNTDVHQRTVVIYNDGTLGIDASKNITNFSGHLNIGENTISSVANATKVLAINEDNYPQFVESSESMQGTGNWTTQRVLKLDGKQSAVVCPSNGMRIAWNLQNSTTACDGGIGVELLVVSS
ncbi:hypothetical protein TRVA0_073S00144 [Trichomonascus vanleenenianus]|uniref:uncharacterized protein n=1 Tax=Trichomonascus vanleenenianus TaxID=2268995 RepID=UPI003ECB150F